MSKSQPTTLGEAEYLAKQAEQAQQAMRNVLNQMKDLFRADIDPRRWPHSHPWLCVGSAAATGFAAAWMLTPSSEESLRQRLDELAGRYHRYMESHASEQPVVHPQAASRTWSTIKKLLTEAISGAAIASMRNISKNIGAEQPAGDGNGHPGEATGEDYEFTNPT